MTPDECWDIVDPIPGHMARIHVDWLFNVSSTMDKDAIILEIGSGSGRSMAALALGLQEGNGGMIYTVDNRQGKSNETIAALEMLIDEGFINKYKSYVGVICGTSPWDLPIEKYDMVWLDGDHNYPQIAIDFMWGFTFLKGDGLLCGHDYGPPQFDTVELVDRYVFGPNGRGFYSVAFTDAGLVGRNTIEDDKVVGGNCIWWGKKKTVI